MIQWLKRLAARIANTRLVRSLVVNLVYPTIVRCLLAEVQPDVNSLSGLVEAFGWKTHSLLVKSEELADGRNCCGERSESTRESRARLLDVVLESAASVPGDVFEFGVASGDSFLTFLERCPERQVYGFDSWEGLPEQWWTRPKGTFAAAPPEFTNANGHLVKGCFNETAPPFFRDYRGHIAILHIDCDLYSSTATALQHAIPCCGPGTVVLFDEYWNYPMFADHEWRAWRRARAECCIVAQCIGYDGRRAAFRISKHGGAWGK
jgi:Methyltransferase domain